MLHDATSIASSLVVEDMVKKKYRNEEPRPKNLKPPLAESPFGMFPKSYHMRDTWGGNKSCRRRDRTPLKIKAASIDPVSYLNRSTPKRLAGHVENVNLKAKETARQKEELRRTGGVVSSPHKSGTLKPLTESIIFGSSTSLNGSKSVASLTGSFDGVNIGEPEVVQRNAGTVKFSGDKKDDGFVPVHLRSNFNVNGSSVIHVPPPRPLTAPERRVLKKKLMEQTNKIENLNNVEKYMRKGGKFVIPTNTLINRENNTINLRPFTAPAIRAGNFLKSKTTKIPKAGAYRKRAIEATLFRKYYERGDLPVKIDHCAGGNKLLWSGDVRTFDYHVYLPIFVDGLREVDDPYRFLSIQGVIDMIQAAPEKLLPVVPQLILPINNALKTREPDIICSVLKILQQMLLQNPNIGQAFVPYFRSILPVFNLFRSREKNMGDQFDYNQRRRLDLGELIRETLEMFETYGGPDAFINIKYMCPTYESVLIK